MGANFHGINPPSPLEDIFANLIFVPSINLSLSAWLTFMQLVTTPMVFNFCGNQPIPEIHKNLEISRYTVYMYIHVNQQKLVKLWRKLYIQTFLILLIAPLSHVNSCSVGIIPSILVPGVARYAQT